MSTGLDKFYLRIYAPHDPRNRNGYLELVLPSAGLVRRIKGQVKIDAVLLSSGAVARHDYKKPLPNWLEDDLIRQMVAATGHVPGNGVDAKPRKS